MTDFAHDFEEQGPPCPRCGQPMVVEPGDFHEEVQASEPDTAYCDNPDCPENREEVKTDD